MKLNHLNLTVTDVPADGQFLQNYFQMQSLGGNNNIGFLTDDSGIILTLTSMKIGGETEVKYPANFHIGFGQESQDHVDDLNRRLREDGFPVPPASYQHGSWRFYFAAPAGYAIEVLSPLTRSSASPAAWHHDLGFTSLRAL